MFDKKDKKNQKDERLEIVKGDGHLNISPVTNHLKVGKTHSKTDKNKIIIPKGKNK